MFNKFEYSFCQMTSQFGGAQYADAPATTNDTGGPA